MSSTHSIPLTTALTGVLTQWMLIVTRGLNSSPSKYQTLCWPKKKSQTLSCRVLLSTHLAASGWKGWRNRVLKLFSAKSEPYYDRGIAAPRASWHSPKVWPTNPCCLARAREEVTCGDLSRAERLEGHVNYYGLLLTQKEAVMYSSAWCQILNNFKIY